METNRDLLTDTLEGVVDNITFQSADGCFVVFKLKPINESSAVVVVGNITAPFVGEQLLLQGQWVEHGRFGRQFKATHVRRIAPTSAVGIEKFLASRAVKGIGPAMAARLVKHFGAKTLEVLEFYPHRLTEVEGIGTKKAEMMRSSFAELSEMREVMLFLETHGVSGGYGTRIFAQYGSQAVDVITENPYRLAAEVVGIGFRTADQLAMSLGFELVHPARLQAGLKFALLQTAQAGHTCVPEKLLVAEGSKLLRVDKVELAIRITEMIKAGELLIEDFHSINLVYPDYLYHAERNAAQALIELKDHAHPIECDDYDGLVAKFETQAGIQLAAAQREAVISALKHGVLVLTGGPGTGKTATVKGILAILEEAGCEIALCAPTGRAAKRLSESCGRKAQTVHRLLESTGGQEGAPYFARNSDNPLEADVVILDEASMLDILLTNSLLKALSLGTRLILVGDVDQLPAVGPGSVLKDIIRSQTVPVVRLTEVFRQAAESMIVQNAHHINRGLNPDVSSSQEFEFKEIQSTAEVAEKIVSLCLHELPERGFSVGEVQVLSPMHRLDCGVDNLNKLLQAGLNPQEFGKATIAVPGGVLREGDKVMQIRNNYEKRVFNGDIGYIRAILPQEVIVHYPEEDVVYQKGELDELHLAYAMSVHKSQGSEYPVVIMPLIPGHYIMLQRSLLYTAVTRAKEKVILLGNKAALNTAVANDRTRRRYSLLAERLRGELLC